MAFRELNDEDGVLGRESEHGEKADLEVDVVGHSPQGRGSDAADDESRDELGSVRIEAHQDERHVRRAHGIGVHGNENDDGRQHRTGGKPGESLESGAGTNALNQGARALR